MNNWKTKLAYLLLQGLVMFNSFPFGQPAKTTNKVKALTQISFVWDAQVEVERFKAGNLSIRTSSPSFSTWEGANEIKWHLELIANDKYHKYAGLFLVAENVPYRKTAFEIAIFNQNEYDNLKEIQIYPDPLASIQGWGWPKLIRSATLVDQRKGYISDDKIRIGVRIASDAIPLVSLVREPCTEQACPLCLECAECPSQECLPCQDCADCSMKPSQPKSTHDVVEEAAPEGDIQLRFDTPKIPSVGIPNIPSVGIPSFGIPSFGLPNIPSANIPGLPNGPTFTSSKDDDTTQEEKNSSTDDTPPQEDTKESSAKTPYQTTGPTYTLYKGVNITVGDKHFSVGDILSSSTSDFLSKVASATNKTRVPVG